MTFKFLIDECLWPGLVEQACQAGHWETTCVRDRGWSGTKDHRLIRYVVDQDFTLVTHNAIDFRGSANGPVGGLHARETIHAGLVCLVSASAMTPVRQQQLFSYALAELATMPDLVNQALEVWEDESGEVTITMYRIPA
ncbi:DUF5615 family PIN-like protein [Caballeronia sordidicola]|uniref:DUF5615 domain-containing protein n=1 Tax=Caballeronia sordidicola TaxID=196367 RepID=A0A242N5F9_CABSO|nr:DUF5615 family PIN-like protein [Caballeronia sordidicola]OTP78881.1 hypothetical protein PAMC26577_03025 [Caballeronia sordidicola]